MGKPHHKNGRRMDKEQLLMRNFTEEFRWENQEQDGRTLFTGMHYRF